jgi:hypothetical protein
MKIFNYEIKILINKIKKQNAQDFFDKLEHDFKSSKKDYSCVTTNKIAEEIKGLIQKDFESYVNIDYVGSKKQQWYIYSTKKIGLNKILFTVKRTIYILDHCY